MPFKVTADLVNAFSYVIKFQHAIKAEQDALRSKLVKVWHAKTTTEDTTPDSALTSIESAIDIDIGIAESDNKAIEAFGKASIPSFPLRFNKAFEIATGVKNLFDTGNISRMLSEEVVEGYSNIPVLPDIHTNPDSFYGTSRSTIYSASIISSLLTLTKESSEPFTPASLLDSNIFHFTPVPAGLELASRYCFIDKSNVHFGFPHSGYTFGGDRVKSCIYDGLSLSNKIFAPDDCSSWVANLTGSSSAYTTRDQKKYGGFEDLPAYTSASAESELAGLYNVVSIDEAVAGDIVVFNAHTGFLLGKDATSVDILSDNRDMPGIEGFCIENKSVGAVKGFLRTKASVISEGALSSLAGEYFESSASLWSLIESILFPVTDGTGEAMGGGSEGAASALGEPGSTFEDVE